MIFELKQKKDKLIENTYEEGLKKLNSFFGLNFEKGKIEIFIVKDRNMINLLRGEKTESWLVSWVNGTSVYLLDRKNFEKESDHKYSDESYSALIIHEMSHVFYKFVPGGPNPVWLNEGVSLYVSGQNNFKKRPEKFANFLKSYHKIERGVYSEAGFFVEFLIKRNVKNKLLDLVKSTINYKNKKEFSKIFKKIYGFELNYKEINKLYNKIK
jgi:hypothetical protein